MQTHLLFCRSADPLSRNLRLNKINMLMLIMEEFQTTYTVASLYRGIFVKAIKQLFPDYQPTSFSGQVAGAEQQNGLDPSASFNAEPVMDDPRVDMGYGAGVVFNDDGFVDAFMDQASLFNLWENWNMV